MQFYDTCKLANDGNKNFNRFSYIFDKVYGADNKMIKDGLAWCATFVISTIGTANMLPFTCELLSKSTDLADFKDFFKKNVEIATGIKDYSQCWTAGVAEIRGFMKNNLGGIGLAKPMDLIIFGNNQHIGFVESFKNGVLTTIEGNTSIGSANSNGGMVCRKRYKVSGANLKLSEIFAERATEVTRPSWSRFEIIKLNLS